jgi:hypothetical protein
MHSDVDIELKRLDNGEGLMLNYMIEDTITKRNIFGIWSIDDQLE